MTIYNCFFAQKENGKWATGFVYNEYKLKRFSYCMVMP